MNRDRVIAELERLAALSERDATRCGDAADRVMARAVLGAYRHAIALVRSIEPAPVAQYDRGKFAEGLPDGRFVSVPAPHEPREDGSEPSQDVRAEARGSGDSWSIMFDGYEIALYGCRSTASGVADIINRALDARAAAAREEGKRNGLLCAQRYVHNDIERALSARLAAAEARAVKAESALTELTRALNALFGWNDGWLHALMHVENAVWNERANLGVAEAERDRAIMERDKARAELIARAALAGQAEERT